MKKAHDSRRGDPALLHISVRFLTTHSRLRVFVEPGYDGDKDKGFDNLSVDMTTHEKLLELEDSRAEVERSGSEAGASRGTPNQHTSLGVLYELVC